MPNRLSIRGQTDKQWMLRGSLQSKLSRSARKQGTHAKVCQRKKNDLLKFHGSQNYFLLVKRWWEAVHFQQCQSWGTLHLLLISFKYKHSEVWFSFELSLLSNKSATCIHLSKSLSPPTPHCSAFWWQHLVILLYHLTTNIFISKY